MNAITIGENRPEYHPPVYHEPVYHEPYHNSYPHSTDATDAVVGGILLLGIGAALLSSDHGDKIKPAGR